MLTAQENLLGREPGTDAAASALHTVAPVRLGNGVDEAGTGLYQALLHEIDVGLVMTGPDGGVLHANRAARRHCEAPSPLVLSGGMLRTADTTDQHTLVHALLLVRQGRRSMMSFRRSGWTHTVGVVPVADRATGQRAALFMLGDQPQRAALNLQFLCQTHQLTFAESAVLSALAQGLTPTQVAQRGGVTVATVRSQITAIREKTHTASLAHLQRLVASLPPLAAAGTLDN